MPEVCCLVKKSWKDLRVTPGRFKKLCLKEIDTEWKRERIFQRGNIIRRSKIRLRRISKMTYH